MVPGDFRHEHGLEHGSWFVAGIGEESVYIRDKRRPVLIRPERRTHGDPLRGIARLDVPNPNPASFTVSVT